MKRKPAPPPVPVRYDVAFMINPTNAKRVKAARGERTIQVEILDRGEESLNESSAIIAATFVLDGEGIDCWDLLKVTRNA